jgi:hypothetical protein
MAKNKSKSNGKNKPAAPSAPEAKEPTKAELKARVKELEDQLAGGPPPVLGEGESSIQVTEITKPTAKKQTIGGEVQYVKSVKNGRVYIKDKFLAGNSDLRPCTKDGKFISTKDAEDDETNMTIQRMVMKITDRKKLVKFCNKYGVEVLKGLKVDEIQASFLELVAKGQVEGVTLLSIVE